MLIRELFANAYIPIEFISPSFISTTEISLFPEKAANPIYLTVLGIAISTIPGLPAKPSSGISVTPLGNPRYSISLKSLKIFADIAPADKTSSSN